MLVAREAVDPDRTRFSLSLFLGLPQREVDGGRK
jgi:hypothetical protein